LTSENFFKIARGVTFVTFGNENLPNYYEIVYRITKYVNLTKFSLAVIINLIYNFYYYI